MWCLKVLLLLHYKTINKYFIQIILLNMKKCIFLILGVLATSNVFSQDFAVLKNATNNATTTNEEPKNIEPHFEVSNCSSTLLTNSRIIKPLAPNYNKLWLATSNDNKSVKLRSNFEGKVVVQYIITNSGGQVMHTQETTLASGAQTLNITMHEYSNGNYFLTAKVISKETKVQSNYTFKVVKK
jgi:hypothetical protein